MPPHKSESVSEGQFYLLDRIVTKRCRGAEFPSNDKVACRADDHATTALHKPGPVAVPDSACDTDSSETIYPFVAESDDRGDRKHCDSVRVIRPVAEPILEFDFAAVDVSFHAKSRFDREHRSAPGEDAAAIECRV